MGKNYKKRHRFVFSYLVRRRPRRVLNNNMITNNKKRKDATKSEKGDDLFTQPQHTKHPVSLYISTSSLAFAARPFERRICIERRASLKRKEVSHIERIKIVHFIFFFYLSWSSIE